MPARVWNVTGLVIEDRTFVFESMRAHAHVHPAAPASARPVPLPVSSPTARLPGVVHATPSPLGPLWVASAGPNATLPRVYRRPNSTAASRKNPAYCIGAHMDRDGCTFAYLSPDANAAGQRAWLHFQPINWRNGGLERIARTFMELEVRGVASFGLRVTVFPLQLVNRTYWDSIAQIMHHLNPALALPRRLATPAEVNTPALLPQACLFEPIGTFAVTRVLPPLHKLTAKVRLLVCAHLMHGCRIMFLLPHHHVRTQQSSSVLPLWKQPVMRVQC